MVECIVSSKAMMQRDHPAAQARRSTLKVPGRTWLANLAIQVIRYLRQIYISLISRGIWLNEAIFFEPRLRSVYQRLHVAAKKGDQVLIMDIGSNRGQAARFFGQLFKNAHIIAVEANPGLVKLLKRKTKHLNIEILPVAVSSSPGVLPFYQCIFDEVSTLEPPNLQSKYLRFKSKVLMSPPKDMYSVINTNATTIDRIVDELNIQSIDILKIDVEGHEHSVLLGAKQTLKRKVPKYIQLEAHQDDQYQQNESDIKSLLEGLGYTLISRLKHGFGNFYEEIYSAI